MKKNNYSLKYLLSLSKKELSDFKTERLNKILTSIDKYLKNSDKEKKIKLNITKLKVLSLLNKNKKIMDIALQTLEYLSDKNYHEKITLYKLIANQYKIKSDYEQAMDYLKKAIKLTLKIKSDKLYFETTLSLANIYLDKKDFNKAKNIYTKLLNFTKSRNLSDELADVYTNLGLLYWYQNNLKKSLNFLKKANSIYETKKEDKKLYILYANLSNIYVHLSDFDKAIDYALQAVQLGEKFKNWEKLSKIYNNLGLMFLRRNNFENAVAYFNKSIRIKKELGDKIGLAKTYNNLSEMMFLKKDYEKSLEYLQKSLKIKTELGDTSGILTSLYNMAKCYLEIDNLRKTIKILRRIEEMDNETDLDDLMSIYELYYIYYKKKKDYKNALKYQKIYLDTYLMKDFNNQKLKTQKLLSKFEDEKAEKEKRYQHLKNIELKRANATKDKFFSIIAHDLKSPFSSITSFISLIKSGYDKFTPEQISKMIDELDKNVKNTYSLLENLLTWSRLQAQTIKFQPKLIKLYITVYKIIEIYKYKADAKNIELINKIATDAFVFADIYMLDTVIRNLVNNAIKFTPKNGKITISSKNLDNSRIQIKVSDTGVGIPKDKINKLFRIESSFSTYGTDNEKGTGLGLILCKEFIEKNNGIISVESTEGKGTTFTITLPTENLDFPEPE